MQSGEMKLEDAKELQNIFKSNLNEILKGKFKSKEQESALEIIRLLYKSQAVIKFFDDCSSIVFEAAYKSIHRKGIPSMSACIPHKIPKQMLQDCHYLFYK